MSLSDRRCFRKVPIGFDLKNNEPFYFERSVKESVKNLKSKWQNKDDEDWKKIKRKDKDFWDGVRIAVDVMIKSIDREMGDELI